VDLDPDPDIENKVNNAVYLDAPAPSKIRVNIYCNGYRTPASVTYSLAPYVKPTSDGAFIWPFSAGDMLTHEYISATGEHWANGGVYGGQIFALDIGIKGSKTKTSSLSELLPDKAGDKNNHFRIWGKPLRAMADGVVESWHDGMATNTQIGDFPKPTPDPGAGNHFWIRHGDVYVVYAHMQKDTLPEELKKKGAVVKAGQKLGLAGNSGNSSGPHTHIQCLKGGTSRSSPLRGFPFQNSWALRTDMYNPPKTTDPWVRMTADGVPKTNVAIWPGSTHPTFKIPAAGISRSGNWANSYWISPDLESFKKTAQDLFDKQGRRLIWFTTYMENGNLRFAGIARSGTWANSFWISNSRAEFEKKAQELFDKEKKRLVYVTTYKVGSKTYWAGIARSGTWANSFWISNSQAAFEKKAQDLFDNQGRRLVHVTTYVQNGKRYWVGIARSGNWANSFWVSNSLSSFNKKAQDLFDKEGRRLVHIHSYKSGSKRYWVGIAQSGTWANSFYVENDLDSFNRKAQDLFDDNGRRMIAVEYLDD
jgi:hypothetical protein